MNFLRDGDGGESTNGFYFVTFNQDSTSLIVGTRNGYRIYSLNSAEDVELIYESPPEEICGVERLFSSSLISVVSVNAPRRLRICHFKKESEICAMNFANSILAVKFNRMRMVVCLEETLFIHNIRDMSNIHIIKDTPPNPRGICALSANQENCFLAYPGASHIGEVQIFDALHLQAKTMIPAHDSPLAAIAFNSSGTKIATASEKGTVIRVFSALDGDRLFEFRRGVKRCVSIFSLAFSPDSMYLCASSNTETVHIFKLEEASESARQPVATEESSPGGGGWMGYLSRAVTASASYLPSQVTEVFSQGRDFACVRLPSQGLRNICTLTVIQKLLRLIIVCEDGYLYIYNVDTTHGGDCVLVKQHWLDIDRTSTGGSLRPKGLPPVIGSPGSIGNPATDPSIPPSFSESEKRSELESAGHESPLFPPADISSGVCDLNLGDEREFPPIAHQMD
ncbi:unnamed protein product [Cyprideis torosa]|uniref:Uncharacterized protein n=1 Tax=Cyprideis torosa TaxID=163714 RepID=A0A7R8WAE0_9CRUS|nr:unnamed protein product [Cyprideis torosa]CAG0888287.1 unnamed protein product [Cyprideis torosa]